MVCRNKERGEAALKEIKEATQNEVQETVVMEGCISQYTRLCIGGMHLSIH